MIKPPWISAQLMQALHRTNAVLYAHLENAPALGVSQGIGSPERCWVSFESWGESPPPFFPVPPPARLCSPSVRYCLRLVCPPFFHLSTVWKAWLVLERERWALELLDYVIRGSPAPPGPCFALRKDLLCWDTGQYPTVLWHGGDQL